MKIKPGSELEFFLGILALCGAILGGFSPIFIAYWIRVWMGLPL
jgi:hypothetical protein